MELVNALNILGSSYDTITVGAFAVHPRGFKSGGMSKLLKSHSSTGGLPSLTKLSQHVSAPSYMYNIYSYSITQVPPYQYASVVYFSLVFETF